MPKQIKHPLEILEKYAYIFTVFTLRNIIAHLIPEEIELIINSNLPN